MNIAELLSANNDLHKSFNTVLVICNSQIYEFLNDCEFYGQMSRGSSEVDKRKPSTQQRQH